MLIYLFLLIETTGEYSTHRNWIVLMRIMKNFIQKRIFQLVTLILHLDEIYTKEQDNVPFGRIETQAARQVMLQKVREAEREKVVAQFKSQNNQLVNGTVKRVTRDNIIVDIAYDAEAILPRDRLMPGEIYKINDRIRAILQIQEVEGRGPQLMLNRSCPEMVTELLALRYQRLMRMLLKLEVLQEMLDQDLR